MEVGGKNFNLLISYKSIYFVFCFKKNSFLALIGKFSFENGPSFTHVILPFVISIRTRLYARFQVRHTSCFPLLPPGAMSCDVIPCHVRHE